MQVTIEKIRAPSYRWAMLSVNRTDDSVDCIAVMHMCSHHGPVFNYKRHKSNLWLTCTLLAHWNAGSGLALFYFLLYIIPERQCNSRQRIRKWLVRLTVGAHQVRICSVTPRKSMVPSHFVGSLCLNGISYKNLFDVTSKKLLCLSFSRIIHIKIRMQEESAQ